MRRMSSSVSTLNKSVRSMPSCLKIFQLIEEIPALTHSFLVGLSLLPPFHPFLVSLSHRPGLLTAMQSYLAHPDPKIRRLGMLEAEVISELSIEDNGEDRPSNQQEELDELKAGLEVDEDSGDPKTPKKPQGSGMKRLRFGKDMWDGDGDGREECRWLRRAVGVRDQHARLSEDSAGKAWMLGWDSIPPTNIPPAPTVIGRPERRGRAEARRPAPSRPQPRIIMLDPDQMADPLEGYANASPTSSRSPSPTPSYLEEVAADPSLALDSTQKKKITRPVYIQQLVALLKEREKPDHLEMGLKWGEGLVRAKRSFGRELGP